MNHVLLPNLNNNYSGIYDSNIDYYLRENVKSLGLQITEECISVSSYINYCLAVRQLEGQVTACLDAFENMFVVEGKCHAYTRKYTNNLYNFGGQHTQLDTYTEYSHWFISLIHGKDISKDKREVLELFIKDNGFVYNEENSDTQFKYRMKNELFLQTLMASEVLGADYFPKIAKSVNSIPSTGYVSAEFYRLRIAQLTKCPKFLTQLEVENLLENCRAKWGMSDFNALQKTDDFMGTKKRAQRDQTIFSPLATLHAIYLCESYGLLDQANVLVSEVKEFYNLFGLKIPHYQMRDIPIPFGPGATIIEILALNSILLQEGRG